MRYVPRFCRGSLPPTLVVILIAVAAGCGSGGTGTESMARIQQAMSVSDFESEIMSDPELQAAYELAAWSLDAWDFLWAGRLEDDGGTRMIYAEMDDGWDPPTVIVRHCDGSDCVSAVQVPGDDDEEIVWTTPDGDIPVRTAQWPFQLRHIEDHDPDGTAVIAPVDGTSDSSFPFFLESALGKADGTPTDPNRKIHITSAFGKYFTLQGPSLDDLKTSMKSGGFPNAESRYHVSEAQVDDSLSNLGKSDAFVWLTHGDLSKSKGKVVGMTVAKAYWGSKHYPSSRMTQQLGKNSKGGPGIVVLAGCMTKDLIPTFDNGERVVLAFDGKVMPGAASYAIKAFFNKLSDGGTLQEALSAANDQITDPSVSLVANPGADLSQKLVDVGGTSDACSPHFAGSWQGKLIVTEGSDKVPLDMSVDYDCGKFVMTQVDGKFDTCLGCTVKGTFVSRVMEGCAKGTNVTLHHTDDGSEMYLDLDIINSSTMSVTNWAKDSDGADITREGTFTRCN